MAKADNGEVQLQEPQRDDQPESCARVDSAMFTGKFMFPDGSTYEGQYTDVGGLRQRHGQGVYEDGGEVYEGEWKEDQMDGQGSYRFATGSHYRGNFVQNAFHGQGEYRWHDGAMYTGGWKSNQMHSPEGKYISSDHVEWTGKFTNGKYYNGKIFLHLR